MSKQNGQHCTARAPKTACSKVRWLYPFWGQSFPKWIQEGIPMCILGESGLREGSILRGWKWRHRDHLPKLVG